MKKSGIIATLLCLASMTRGFYQEYRLAGKLCNQLPDEFGPWPLDSFLLTKTLEFFIPLKSNDQTDDQTDVSTLSFSFEYLFRT